MGVLGGREGFSPAFGGVEKDKGGDGADILVGILCICSDSSACICFHMFTCGGSTFTCGDM